MRDINIRDCTLEPTSSLCPSCPTLLQKVTPIGVHSFFKVFYICPNSSCKFVGSIDVEQSEILRNILRRSELKLIDFTVNRIRGYTPTAVRFKENSFGLDAQNHVWDFGDGNHRTGDNIIHTYTSPGIYTVSLTIFDETIGTQTITKENLIQIDDFTHPVAIFDVDVSSGFRPLQVHFINNSLGSELTGYEWDFGTGDISTTISPYYIFEEPGIYDVSLTVHDARGNNDTVIMYGCVEVLVAPPNADFTASVITGYDPLEVLFTNTSTGEYIESINWDFGDGNFSSEENPSHIYTSFGTYTVTLSVTNISGTSEKTLDIEVLEYEGPPEADAIIELPLSLESLPMTVSFENNSTISGIKSLYWDFGDGTIIEDEENVTHNYLSYGIYNVSLTITDSRDITSVYNVILNLDIEEPKAIFDYHLMGDGYVQFTNESVGDYLLYYWEFGDGSSSEEEHPIHYFSDTIPYNISLTANNSKGSDTTSITIFAYN